MLALIFAVRDKQLCQIPELSKKSINQVLKDAIRGSTLIKCAHNTASCLSCTKMMNSPNFFTVANYLQLYCAFAYVIYINLCV